MSIVMLIYHDLIHIFVQINKGPILRRSAVGKDNKSNLSQTIQSEEIDEEPQGLSKVCKFEHLVGNLV